MPNSTSWTVNRQMGAEFLPTTGMSGSTFSSTIGQLTTVITVQATIADRLVETNNIPVNEIHLDIRPMIENSDSLIGGQSKQLELYSTTPSVTPEIIQAALSEGTWTINGVEGVTINENGTVNVPYTVSSGTVNIQLETNERTFSTTATIEALELELINEDGQPMSSIVAGNNLNLTVRSTNNPTANLNDATWNVVGATEDANTMIVGSGANSVLSVGLGQTSANLTASVEIHDQNLSFPIEITVPTFTIARELSEGAIFAGRYAEFTIQSDNEEWLNAVNDVINFEANAVLGHQELETVAGLAGTKMNGGTLQTSPIQETTVAVVSANIPGRVTSNTIDIPIVELEFRVDASGSGNMNSGQTRDFTLVAINDPTQVLFPIWSATGSSTFNGNTMTAIGLGSTTVSATLENKTVSETIPIAIVSNFPSAPAQIAGINRCPQAGAVATYGNSVVTADYSIWADSTGFQWCVVATEGDYSMLVARHTLQMTDSRWNNGVTNNRVHSSNNHIAWPATTAGTGGPEGRTRVNLWWNHNTQVSPELRAQAVHANIPANNNDFTLFGGSGANQNARLSTPTGELAGTGNPVFFLSDTEVYQRLGQTNNASRITHRVNHTTFASTGSATFYWLRSVGNDVIRVARVNVDGNWRSHTAAGTPTYAAIRPAIWVRR